MNNREFLKNNPLELVVFESEIEQVRSILKQANRDFVLLHKEEKEDHISFGEQRYIFRINCPTTNFAMAYFHLGRQIHTILSKRKLGNEIKNNKN